jgi:hypothetical protein
MKYVFENLWTLSHLCETALVSISTEMPSGMNVYKAKLKCYKKVTLLFYPNHFAGVVVPPGYFIATIDYFCQYFKFTLPFLPIEQDCFDAR